jgi:hypothetical protein
MSIMEAPPPEPLGPWLRHDYTPSGKPLRFWVEDDIDGFPAWRSVLVFFAVKPRLVLGEVEVIPATERRQWLLDHPGSSTADLREHFPAGIWSHDPDSLAAVGDGVPGRLFRHIKVSAARHQVLRYLRNSSIITISGFPFETFDLDALAPGAPDEWMQQQARRPRSAGRDKLFHATWARRYVEALEIDPLRPAVEMARLHGVTVKQARYQVNQARNHGMLQSTDQGRAGGGLTEKAALLLDEQTAAETSQAPRQTARPKPSSKGSCR